MRTQFICLALAIVLLCPFASAQWVQTSLPDSLWVSCIAVSGANLFAGTPDYGVFLSTDNGTTWSAVNSGLTNTRVSALAGSGTNVFAGTDRGVFRSTNNGASWTEANAGLPFNTRGVSAFAMSGQYLFASLYAEVLLAAHGVFLSTNNGTSWTEVDSGLTNMYGRKPGIHALIVSGANLFAGTDDGVFVSANDGTSWSAASSGLPKNQSAAVISVITIAASPNGASGMNLYAGTFNGVFLSTNNGTNWTQVNSGLTDTLVIVLFADRSRLFAGTPRDVFLSTNNGTSWTQAGLTNNYVYCLVVSGTNLFAGTYAGVWRRPLAEMITSVDPSVDLVPTVFKLEQNYPNPFNPSTTIRYGLPQRSEVILMVFNTLGQQVATLVQGDQQAGYHEVRFDASGLSSGVYFYRLSAGQFVQTRKLLLLR